MAIGRKEESIVLFNHRRCNTCGCPLSKCPLIPFAYPVCRHSSDTSTLWREQREIWCKPQLRFCLKSWQSRFATRRFDRFPPQARNKFRRRFLPRIDSFESQFKSIDDGAFSMMLEWKWSCQWIVSLVCFVLSRENFGKSWEQSGSFFFLYFSWKHFSPQWLWYILYQVYLVQIYADIWLDLFYSILSLNREFASCIQILHELFEKLLWCTCF